MTNKIDLTNEIRRITNETASLAAQKALEVAETAKTKAAEVSTLAIAEALKAATLAASKAADAATAAAQLAASTSKDLEYIKKDIADTKIDIKEIKESLTNKYATKEDLAAFVKEVADKKYVTADQFSAVRSVVYGMVSLILVSVVGGLMALLIRK